MIAKPVALLMSDLGVAPSHSRPQVSNDNPFSEAQFKTLKYQPNFPERFGSRREARTWAQTFFAWYNTEHHHSGIGFMTPAAVHSGTAARLYADRQHTLSAAYTAHPERFVKGRPVPPPLPRAVWINPPKPTTEPRRRRGCGPCGQLGAERCPQVHSLLTRKELDLAIPTVQFDSKFSTQLS